MSRPREMVPTNLHSAIADGIVDGDENRMLCGRRTSFRVGMREGCVMCRELESALQSPELT